MSTSDHGRVAECTCNVRTRRGHRWPNLWKQLTRAVDVSVYMCVVYTRVVYHRGIS